MPDRRRFIGLAAAAAAVALLCGASGEALAADPIVFKISQDSAPDHVRSIQMRRFAELLQERAGDRLKVEYYEAGQLMPDRDVPKALRQGSIQMAVPGTWILEGFAPDAAVVALPMFFGLSRDESFAVVDGELGERIAASVMERLPVEVIGALVDVGYSATWTTKTPLRKIEDMKGLKIRLPGSPALVAQYTAFGATPTVIPWPDTPMALSQGTVDGLITNFEAARSIKIWDTGIRYALETRNLMSYYMPMVVRRTWDGLDNDLKQTIKSTWAEVAADWRAFSAEREAEAKQILKENGIEIVLPSREELAAVRASLIEIQGPVVEKLKVDPALVEVARKAIDSLD